MVVSESPFTHQVNADLLPFREAFAVLFFVSVGMLFDPAVLIEEPLHVAGIVAIIIVGKATAAFLIVIGIGYGLRTGIVVSAALAQVGEFSFILIGLGGELGLLPTEGKDLVLAGALISITLNPLTFMIAGELQKWVRVTWPGLTAICPVAGSWRRPSRPPPLLLRRTAASPYQPFENGL